MAEESRSVSVEEIFWSRVDRPSPYCCWEWLAGKTPEGYGMFHGGLGKNRLVHRLAYEWLVGPIPEGLNLDHLCRNTLCVNPLHLEPVTQRINVLRGKGLAAQNARKTHCKRGHPLNEAWVYRGQRLCRVCRNAATRRWKEARRGA